MSLLEKSHAEMKSRGASEVVVALVTGMPNGGILELRVRFGPNPGRSTPTARRLLGPHNHASPRLPKSPGGLVRDAELYVAYRETPLEEVYWCTFTSAQTMELLESACSAFPRIAAPLV